MKKILACILAAVLLLGMFPAAAEEAGKYDKLTVGTTTPFSGNFLDGALGNNISDQDVRRLIHGYHLVYWDSASGVYQFDNRLVTAKAGSEDGLTYVITIESGLTYNDGMPITVRDYAFSLLLLGSPALKEAAGGQADLSRILGGKAYTEGQTAKLEGVRILGDNMFSVTLDREFLPYFYELQALDISPLPIHSIAPGCQVVDDGDGAYINGSFSASLLKQTLTNKENGYITHPRVTCGPYMLTDYDGTKVTLDLNPKYAGDAEGNIPTIPRIVYQTEDPGLVFGRLAAGEIDLIVRCARADQIRTGMEMAAGEDFGMVAYSRAGLSFISFCAEKGPTADENVRKALIMCLDRTTLTEQYLGSYGTVVDGFYGIGQWMFRMANGSLIPEEGQEAEWADLKLDGIPKYQLDTDQAERLLEQAGWTLDAEGNPYKTGQGIRYKKEGDSLVPLNLKLVYPDENGAIGQIPFTFETYLNRVGAGLQLQGLPMAELLKLYYRQTERDCDMILLGTNLGDIFEPSGEYDAEGTNLRSGITDKTLAELAIRMRQTEPGQAPEFCRRWLAYQQRFMEIVAAIPIYSDAYLDFHVAALQNYMPGSSGSWAVAVTKAFLSDFVPEAAGEEELPEEAGDESLEEFPE